MHRASRVVDADIGGPAVRRERDGLGRPLWDLDGPGHPVSGRVKHGDRACTWIGDVGELAVRRDLDIAGILPDLYGPRHRGNGEAGHAACRRGSAGPCRAAWGLRGRSAARFRPMGSRDDERDRNCHCRGYGQNQHGEASPAGPEYAATRPVPARRLAAGTAGAAVARRRRAGLAAVRGDRAVPRRARLAADEHRLGLRGERSRFLVGEFPRIAVRCRRRRLSRVGRCHWRRRVASGGRRRVTGRHRRGRGVPDARVIDGRHAEAHFRRRVAAGCGAL